MRLKVFYWLVLTLALGVQDATPPVLVGAGDIASCSYDDDEATAKLLDSIPGVVFTAGDDAYPFGTPGQFARCYAPTRGSSSWTSHSAGSIGSTAANSSRGPGSAGATPPCCASPTTSAIARRSTACSSWTPVASSRTVRPPRWRRCPLRGTEPCWSRNEPFARCSAPTVPGGYSSSTAGGWARSPRQMMISDTTAPFDDASCCHRLASDSTR